MILVIIDQKGLRENITELLELNNYQVEGLESPPAELDALVTFKPELIIYSSKTDKNGWEFARSALTTSSMAHIPTIFLTHQEITDYKKSSGKFQHAFLQLPFETKSLLKTVGNSLEVRNIRNRTLKKPQGGRKKENF